MGPGSRVVHRHREPLAEAYRPPAKSVFSLTHTTLDGLIGDGVRFPLYIPQATGAERRPIHA